MFHNLFLMPLQILLSRRLLPKVGGGRVAARELLIRNSAVSNLIREGKIAQLKSVMEMHSKNGMNTLDNHLKELYNAGEIDKKTLALYSDETESI
jgi:twitching motility protein PilT